MRGRLWLDLFTKQMKSDWKRMNKEYELVKKDSKWTEIMGEEIKKISKKMNCYVAQLRKKNEGYSGEYFNLDAVHLDIGKNTLVHPDNDWDPFVLPKAIIEHENNYDKEKIAYCFWKLLCVRSPIRVLICYQKEQGGVGDLIKYLQMVEWNGSLTRGDTGDFILIIGDESTEGLKPSDYFTVYEWQINQFVKVEEIEW